MATISSLFVRLGLTSSGFTSGMKAASASVKELGHVVESVSPLLGLMEAIVAPVAAVGLAVAGVSESLASFGRQSTAIHKLDAALNASGQAARVSAKHVQELAEALQEQTNFSSGATMGAAALISSFRNINAETFDQVLKSAQDLTAAMGGDLSSNAELLAKAMQNPELGIKRLQKAFGIFTPTQLAAATAMAEAGNIAGAQGAIFDALGSKFGGMAHETQSAGTQFTNAVDDLAGAVGGVVAPFLGLIKSALQPAVSWLTHLFTVMRQFGAQVVAMSPWVVTLAKVIAGAVIAFVAYQAAMKAAALSQTILLAMSGPAGWAALAAGAVIAATAVVALNTEFATIDESIKKSASGADGLTAGMDATAEKTKTAAQKAKELAEEYKKAQEAVTKTTQEMQEKIDTFGFSDARKLLYEYIKQLEEVNKLRGRTYADRLDSEQLAGVEKFKSQIAALEVLEKQKELTKELKEIQKDADQAYMTDSQKKLAKIKELAIASGKTGRELAHAISDAQAKLAVSDAPEKRKKEVDKLIEEKKKLVGDDGPKSLTEQIKDIKEQKFKDIESPKALLKGSAEAALAENRQANPIEKMTQLQRETVAKLEAQRVIAKDQLKALEKEKEFIAQF